MIPKTIHYCWFGQSDLPPCAIKCVESWKKFCPEYEIKRWDESNLDLTINDYVKEAAAVRKWSLVTDYFRFKVVYDYGGIYLDTDVELLKPLDALLLNRAYMGIESTGGINTGSGFGAEKNHPLLKELKESFDSVQFNAEKPPIFSVIDSVMRRKGYVFNNEIQYLNDVVVYPMDYFAPINLTTRKMNVTPNTYSIHHYSGSWVPDEKRKDTKLRASLCRLFGDKMGLIVYGVHNSLKKEGFVRFFKKRVLKFLSRKL